VPGAQRIEVALLVDQEVMLTMDGQVAWPLRERDVVEVQKAAARIRSCASRRRTFLGPSAPSSSGANARLLPPGLRWRRQRRRSNAAYRTGYFLSGARD